MIDRYLYKWYYKMYIKCAIKNPNLTTLNTSFFVIIILVEFKREDDYNDKSDIRENNKNRRLTVL